MWTPSWAFATPWAGTRTWPSAWLAAGLPTVTGKSARENTCAKSRSPAMAAKPASAFITGSIPISRFLSPPSCAVSPITRLTNRTSLPLPGYYFQELSADRFVLLSGQYAIPLERSKQWGLMASAATALVDYLPGLEQPGRWNSGAGAGIVFRSKSEAWHVMLGYAYGIDAIRD